MRFKAIVLAAASAIGLGVDPRRFGDRVVVSSGEKPKASGKTKPEKKAKRKAQREARRRNRK